MKEIVARRPRFRRDPDFPKMRLTERDKAIISAVRRHRFLTTSLIVTLVPGSRQNISRRLQRLYHAGFLDRPRAQLPLHYSDELSEFVYSAHRDGNAGRGHKPITSIYLSHALMVSEFLVRIESACHRHGMAFITEQEILYEKRLKEPMRGIYWRLSLGIGYSNEMVGVRPDGAFAIERGGYRRHYFLEADRGTMPIERKDFRLSSIRRKAVSYAETARRKMLKVLFGIPGFQIIFVVDSEVRMGSMEKTILEATAGGSDDLFIFNTLEKLRQDIDHWVIGLWPANQRANVTKNPSELPRGGTAGLIRESH